MRPAPSFRIDSRAIRLWQVHGLIQTAVVVAMGMSTATVAIPVADLPPWVALLMLPLVATYGVAVVVVFPRVRWRLWRYQLDANELDLQHGMLVVRRTLVPLVRVQHVDTVQGPLAKL
ncbi:MAG: PH domain-containing protein, partial [Polyangiaceae bacterium]|nr:PH domain-containing protein [Polyangiaceae bacterium]